MCQVAALVNNKKLVTRCCVSFVDRSSPRSAVPYGLAADEGDRSLASLCEDTGGASEMLPSSSTQSLLHVQYGKVIVSTTCVSPSLHQPFEKFSFRIQRQNHMLYFSCIYMPFTL